MHGVWLDHALPWWTWTLEVVYYLLLDLVWMFERHSSLKCWISMELGDLMLLMHEGSLCAWSRVGYFRGGYWALDSTGLLGCLHGGLHLTCGFLGWGSGYVGVGVLKVTHDLGYALSLRRHMTMEIHWRFRPLEDCWTFWSSAYAM